MKSIITHTLTVLSALSLSSNICWAGEIKSTSLFNGKDLTGWTVVNANNLKYWSVIDGIVTASNGDKKMPTNTYLATNKAYQNFEFTCKFRLSGDHKTGLINSGIQYRSLLKRNTKNLKQKKIIGYQADIGKGYWGDIYDEHRRGLLAKAQTKKLFKNFKEDGWNDYMIRCIGDRHELYINGQKTADYTEKNPSIESYGFIALQLHSGGVAKMEYKDINIKELPATKMELPLRISAPEIKIHGKTMHLRNGAIVSWNKTNELLEFTAPSHLKPGKYKVTLNYSCDANRQGSVMKLSSPNNQEINFSTIGKSRKWSPASHSIGELELKPNDSLKLQCLNLKADWVLDFHSLSFEQVK